MMRISLSHRQYSEQRQTMTILNNDIIYGDNRIRSNSDQMLTRLSDCLPILVQCWSQSWSYTICPITTVVVQFKNLISLGRRFFIAQPKYFMILGLTLMMWKLKGIKRFHINSFFWAEWKTCLVSKKPHMINHWI